MWRPCLIVVVGSLLCGPALAEGADKTKANIKQKEQVRDAQKQYEAKQSQKQSYQKTDSGAQRRSGKR